MTELSEPFNENLARKEVVQENHNKWVRSEELKKLADYEALSLEHQVADIMLEEFPFASKLNFRGGSSAGQRLGPTDKIPHEVAFGAEKYVWLSTRKCHPL